MNLRPHHFLCIQKFTGHGYDTNFTNHMTGVIQQLKKGQQVTIQEGCDHLCAACPHKIDHQCVSFDKVKKLDEGVLSICGFSYEQEGEWSVHRFLQGSVEAQGLFLDCLHVMYLAQPGLCWFMQGQMEL